jgi:AbiV family abortive infection protein
MASPDSLLRGGWYALEQAGRLMKDAEVLFEAGSHSTAAGLALLSREELAKSRRLFALWMRTARGQQVTREQMIEDIDMDHVAKQRHGASSFTLSIDAATRAILDRGRDAAPAEFDDARRRLDARFDRLMKKAPNTRHQQRLRAFYVDPANDENAWLRPSDLTRSEAQDILIDAGKDYWQHRRPGMPGRTSDIAALDAALAAWQDKPELPPAEWKWGPKG